MYLPYYEQRVLLDQRIDLNLEHAQHWLSANKENVLFALAFDRATAVLECHLSAVVRHAFGEGQLKLLGRPPD